MKSENGRFKVLESQNFLHNKICSNWKYSSNHSLVDEEFFDCLNSIKKNELCPFIIIDVREEHEFEIFQLPSKNKVIYIFIKKNGISIPLIYRSMSEINHGNFEDFDFNKYLICVDYTGILGRKASQILYREGFMTMYVIGGYDSYLIYSGSRNI